MANHGGNVLKGADGNFFDKIFRKKTAFICVQLIVIVNIKATFKQKQISIFTSYVRTEMR